MKFRHFFPGYCLLFFLVSGLGFSADKKNKVAVFSENQISYLKNLLKQKKQDKTVTRQERKLIIELLTKLKSRNQTASGKIRRKSLEAELLTMLRREVAGKPHSRPARLALIRYYIYNGEDEKAALHLDQMGPGSDEDVFWPLLATYVQMRLGEHKRASESLERGGKAIELLLPLRLRRAVLCQSIRQHGQYKKRGNDALVVGESTWLYVEVVGSVFKKQTDGSMLLNLSFALEIRDELQRSVWLENNYCHISPVYQHRVREVFAGIDFVVPPGMRPGKYTLLITCKDNNSDKKSTGSLVFEVKDK